jgi:hypothetical protein
MRVGSHYQCYRGNSESFANPSPTAQSCPDENGNNAIIFRSSKVTSTGCNWVYAYWFVNNGGSWSIKKSQQSDLNCSESISLGNALQMVDTGNVTITDVKFNTVPDNTHRHSRFDINIIGYAGAKEKERNYFDVRTSVSQRIAD